MSTRSRRRSTTLGGTSRSSRPRALAGKEERQGERELRREDPRARADARPQTYELEIAGEPLRD